MVGGGVGVAPLVGCCHRAEPGCSIDFCYGGRSSAEIQRFEWMEARAKEIRLHPSTDDGSAGHKGFCTEVAEALLAENGYDRIYTCGPWIMMKKVADFARTRSIPFEASLEVQMGCGMGACLACVYRTHEGEFVRSCIDGPVVDGNEVVWEREE
jgi:dihydroorotate dehydrogenase electron transfer subunit